MLDLARRPAGLFRRDFLSLSFSCLDKAVKLFLRTHDLVVPVTHAGSSRNEVSYDDVLLQTSEVVFFSADRSLIEDLGRFLEGCR